jgi:ABC-type transport system substrate-binding protein
VALATSVVALLATPGVTGAAVVIQKKPVIDKTAVLRDAIPVGDQGGSSFDPLNATPNPYNGQWMDLIYDVMIHDAPDGKGAPGLATKWSTPDASTAEFTLRQGVKFSDGTPFNAAAVKAAWEKIAKSPQTFIAPEVKAITSVDAVDDNTVRVHFSQPVAATFVDTLAHHSWFLAVPSPAAEAAGTLNTKPVGAGPYVLKDYTKDQKITLEKNPSYYDPKAQLLGGFEFSRASQGPPQVSALQAGTADLIWSLPPDAIGTLKNTPGLEVTALPGTRVYDIGLCATSGPFASKEARQALQYAIDRKALNEGAMASSGLPWQTAIAQTAPYYNKKLNQTYSYNPKKAKALLKKAGVAPGTTVNALSSTAPPQPAIGEILQSQLKAVGLNVNYHSTTNVVDDVLRTKPDLALAAFDSGLWGVAFTSGTTTLNPCGWSNDQVKQDLLTMQDGTKAAAEKQQAADDFQKTLLDESPVVFTLLNPLTAAHNTKVKGIDIITNPYGPNLERVYMTK